MQRISHVETFFAATGANVVHGGSRACYVPSTDNIHKPCIDFFGMQRAITPHAPTKPAIGLATLPGSTANSAGDEGYAMEELVAELGSTFLSADLELTPEVREDHERRVECQRHRHGDEFQR